MDVSAGEEDYLACLALVKESGTVAGTQVWAYCQMTKPDTA